MSTPSDVAKVYSSMHKDFVRFGGEFKTILVSEKLADLMKNLMIERAMRMGLPFPLDEGTVYFKGVPIVSCDRLRDMDYSFVRGAE